MKKLIIAVAALAVAVIGFGALGSTVTQAQPAKVWTVNQNVLAALQVADGVTGCTGFNPGTGSLACDPRIPGDLAKIISGIGLDAAQTASAAQVGTASSTGEVYVIAQTDGSTTDMTLNPKGLDIDTTVGQALTAGLVHCPQNTTTAFPPVGNGTADVDCSAGTGGDGYVVYTLDGPGANSLGTALSLDVLQDGVQLSSSVTVVGPATVLTTPVTTKATVQESAPSCALTDSTSDPTRTGILATITDVNGTSIAGVPVSWASSAASTMKLALNGAAVTLNIANVGVGSGNVACGVAPGTANANVTAAANILAGQTAAVTRSLAITVTGVPAAIALTASPAAIPCDGTSTSTVTAKVTDSAGNNVVDNTPVTFSVVALGTANPINTKTTGGSATSTITPLSGGTAGVVVQVTAGSAASSVRIDCLPSLATATAAAGGGAATATPRTGITGPNTGTGGYLGNNSSSGFPMWTLIALALGSFVLVGGGIVARRSK